MSTDYSEDALVEQPAIALFSQLAYETANCWADPNSGETVYYGSAPDEYEASKNPEPNLADGSPWEKQLAANGICVRIENSRRVYFVADPGRYKTAYASS